MKSVLSRACRSSFVYCSQGEGFIVHCLSYPGPGDTRFRQEPKAGSPTAAGGVQGPVPLSLEDEKVGGFRVKMRNELRGEGASGWEACSRIWILETALKFGDQMA